MIMKTTHLKLAALICFILASQTISAQLSGNSSPAVSGATSWYLGGNIIVPPFNWNPSVSCGNCPQPVFDAGTSNNFPFILKSNDQPALFIMPSTKVGIGLYNNIPGAQLDVCKVDPIGDPNLTDMSHFKIFGDGPGNLESTTGINMNYAIGKNMFFREGTASSAATRMSILTGGDVAIGGPGGGSKLTVDASNTVGNGLNIITNNIGYAFAIHNPNGAVHAIWNDGRVAIGNTNCPDMAKLNINMVAAGEAINVYDMTSTTTNKTNFRVYNTGKTIIGHETQNGNGLHWNAMLTVRGKAVAQSVYVTMSNWSDYVFDKNYHLMPLMEVENYILNNKHLPNIPAAAEITGDNSNLNLGEMQQLQMEKIEELFLHLIKQEKEIEALKKQNAELVKRMN